MMLIVLMVMSFWEHKASIELDDYHENGMWSLSSIYLSDIVGNEFSSRHTETDSCIRN